MSKAIEEAKDSMCGLFEGTRYELDEIFGPVERENEELRGFVYDMWNDMNVYYTQHERPDSSDMDFYRDRMRKLGMEV